MTIPDSVTYLGADAFRNSDSLTRVIIRTGVTKINPRTFYGCDRLEYVSIYGAVTEIGKEAFSFCPNLQSFSIRDSVTTIRERAFAFSGLRGITIPSSVANVGNQAFFACKSLNTITFCSGLTLSYNALQDSGIKYVVFLSSPPVFETYMGEQIQFSGMTATALYPAGNSAWTSSIMQDYGGSITWKSYVDQGQCGAEMHWALLPGGELYIFGTGDMWSETTQGFTKYRDSVTSVTITDGVTSIGSYAFSNFSALRTVTIGNSVKTIKPHAFQYCTQLTNVSFGSSVESIMDHAFQNCASLADLTFPVSLKDIYYRCIVKDSNGNSVTSNAAKLIVN